ncbi:TetR/AcrR family transcriptional regulator [Massilia antarctica]|uniref:TetR/AcrR family transcriptional regulator n=1 Tax=Massilia antarctica TaxID=2765360 RepID=UPI0006BB8FFA|nr:TetR/AcrR family transcriptional regulator [Massilia sp. H27-R4]MCY0912231.1 TetR/AcrR family transcriptional regulator [Massilia sp. H27-R4]CUI06274.1 Transcriptional regulator, TetR family [Janthinobacterium sp. CG23_2]CUU30060.1 Transcriptional regulator, TetR family [Janthinobacterium sp. CG23_2]
MVRLAKYNAHTFIDGAIGIAATCGIGSVSMSAIAIRAGAPIGSVYHRFDSRSTLLAHAWLTVKADFREQVARHWDEEDTWIAVAALLDWCRGKPVYARFLLQYEDCPDLGAPPTAELNELLEAEQARLDACFERCLRRRGGDGDDAAHTLRFMLIDAPIAIVKPYLAQNKPIPATLDSILRASHDAVGALAASPH